MRRIVAFSLLITLLPSLTACGTKYLAPLPHRDAALDFGSEPVGGVVLVTGDTVTFLRDPPARLVNDTIYARLSGSDYYRVSLTDVESILVMRFDLDEESETNEALVVAAALGGVLVALLASGFLDYDLPDFGKLNIN